MPVLRKLALVELVRTAERRIAAAMAFLVELPFAERIPVAFRPAEQPMAVVLAAAGRFAEVCWPAEQLRPDR